MSENGFLFWFQFNCDSSWLKEHLFIIWCSFLNTDTFTVQLPKIRFVEIFIYCWANNTAVEFTQVFTVHSSGFETLIYYYLFSGFQFNFYAISLIFANRSFHILTYLT